MSQIKFPTAGERVYYFPNGKDAVCENMFAAFLPAIVVESTDMAPSLSVMTLKEDTPVVLRLSVQHKSAVYCNGIYHSPYWDWPDKK